MNLKEKNSMSTTVIKYENRLNELVLEKFNSMEYNVFFAIIANLQEKLLDEGITERGIIAADTFDFDMIEKIYVPFDNLVLNVGLKADGNTDMSVIASIADAVKCDFSDINQKEKLIKKGSKLILL